jgi:hypothetical protein
MATGYGVEAGSWRWPNENPAAFIDLSVFAKAAQVAERGKLGAFL